MLVPGCLGLILHAPLLVACLYVSDLSLLALVIYVLDTLTSWIYLCVSVPFIWDPTSTSNPKP